MRSKHPPRYPNPWPARQAGQCLRHHGLPGLGAARRDCRVEGRRAERLPEALDRCIVFRDVARRHRRMQSRLGLAQAAVDPRGNLVVTAAGRLRRSR